MPTIIFTNRSSQKIGGGGVILTEDHMEDVLRAVRNLEKTQVLVGVPSDKAARTPDPAEHEATRDINNAELAYIHEFGAPEAGIPPRPVLIPGITKVQDKLAADLKKAGEDAMDGKSPDTVDKAFHTAGIRAVNSVVDQFTEGNLTPLKPATIKARERRGRTGTNPLIDRGLLRRAYTYVVVKKDGSEGSS